MRGCEIYWGVDKADQMQALVERSTGQKCPCFRDEACPLLPANVALPTPQVRAASRQSPAA